MKKEMVGEVPGNILGMLADLAHKLQHGAISPEELGLFLKQKRRGPSESASDIDQPLADWPIFYRDFFDLDMDISNVHIPEKRDGFGRLIIAAQGLGPGYVYDVCQKNFSCGRCTNDLDEATKGLNEREPARHYAIWVRDRVEADREFKDFSANQVKEQGLKT